MVVDAVAVVATAAVASVAAAEPAGSCQRARLGSRRPFFCSPRIS